MGNLFLIADRLHKTVAEVCQMTELEYLYWCAWLELDAERRS